MVNLEILKNVIKYILEYDIQDGVLKRTTEKKFEEAKETIEDYTRVAKELYSIFGVEETIEESIKFAEALEKEGKTHPNQPIKLKKKKLKEEIVFSGLYIENYLDNAKKFHDIQPFFFNKSNIFWFWNPKENKYEIIDETDIMIALEKRFNFFGQTISTRVKSQYIEAFKRVGRMELPEDAPKHWVQFKDKAYNIKTKEVHEVTSQHFFTNPIPWEIGKTEDTPTLDKLFEEWVGKDYVKTLYEIMAYCCYKDYPIQVLFCLFGNGRNGKSTFLKILSKFIGLENIGSTELDLLVGNTSSRFESFKLYKKLICLMGETNFGYLNKSSLIKKLTGGDMIGFEMKGKNPFDDYNYAKMIIASNSLPTSEDTSEGFYRRWVIIDFPNQFPEGKDISETIPEQEYNNLALKCSRIITELLEKGSFTNQGDIKSRKLRYIMASNPIPMFLKERCERGFDYFVGSNELYNAYVQYLQHNKKRKVNRKEFKSALEDEGYWVERCSKTLGEDTFGGQKYKTSYWIDGIKLKQNYDNYDNYAVNPNSNSPPEASVGKSCIKDINVINEKPTYKEEVLENPTESLIYNQFLEDNSPQEIKVKILEIIKFIPKDNANLIDEYFDPKMLDSMKKSGEIMENPKGTYQRLE